MSRADRIVRRSSHEIGVSMDSSSGSLIYRGQCGCGWRSAPAYSHEQAQKRAEEHAAERYAGRR